jgi:hypothetical protein
LGELPAVELSTLPLIPEVLLCFYSYFIWFSCIFQSVLARQIIIVL